MLREVRLSDSILIRLTITIDSADSLACGKYRDMFDCADQKIMAKKRLRNLKNGTGYLSPARSLLPGL